MVFEIVERRVTDSLKPLRELLAASLDHLEALYNRGDAITGVPTGYTDLDERLSGLQPSALVIVGPARRWARRPSPWGRPPMPPSRRGCPCCSFPWR